MNMDSPKLLPHLPAFITGSISSICYSKVKIKGKWNSRCFTISMDMLVYFVIFIVFSTATQGLFYSLIHYPMIFPFQGPDGSLGGNNFVSIPLSFILFKETLWPGPVSRFLELNFFRFCGKISYPLYLTHPFPISWWKNIETYYDRLVVLLSSSILIAYILHCALEIPLQKITLKINKYLQSKECGDKSLITEEHEEFNLVAHSETPC